MKNIKRYMLILLVVSIFTACGDPDPSVEIDSLSAWGDEFYHGEKVKVWMVVKTDNLPAARYTWTCNEGKFTQPQTLDENTWQAPYEAGTYQITCTVDVDGVKRTRSRDMVVSPIFFFDKFERLPMSFSTSGGNSSLNQVLDATTKTSHAETRVSSTSAVRGFITRNFDNPELRVPFSTMAQLGWISNFPAKDIKIGSNVAENTIYYEWTMNRDPDKLDNLYVDNLRFEWYPVGKSNGLPKDPLNNPYNGVLVFRVRDVATNTTTNNSVYVNNSALSFAKNELKNVSMTIDADYMVHVFVGGVEIINTDAIKTWRTTNASQDDIYINQWRLNFVSNTGGQAPLLYFDEVFALMRYSHAMMVWYYNNFIGLNRREGLLGCSLFFTTKDCI
jgi:hypothetical protein